MLLAYAFSSIIFEGLPDFIFVRELLKNQRATKDSAGSAVSESTSACARCGAVFTCAMVAGSSEPCWCTRLPPLETLDPSLESCLCESCLRAALAAQNA
jgi:hypothetical protein